jgi:hypothetical protein
VLAQVLLDPVIIEERVIDIEKEYKWTALFQFHFIELDRPLRYHYCCGGFMKRAIVTLLSIAICSTAVFAQAQGVVFVQKETTNGQSVTNQVQMDKTHIRAESSAAGNPMAFIFDGQNQTALMVDMNKKTYTEITKADADRLRQQADSAMSQVQSQLANLPPEQRKIVEQMMRGRGGLPGANAAPAPKVQYRAAGSDKVGQWACTKYEGYVGAQKTEEVCTVDPKEFGLAPGDFDVARQLAEFVKAMSPAAADRIMFNGTVQEQGFAGIPVRHTSYRNGAVQSVSEIVEFHNQAIPASTFDAPAGFRKEALPQGARR